MKIGIIELTFEQYYKQECPVCLTTDCFSNSNGLEYRCGFSCSIRKEDGELLEPFFIRVINPCSNHIDEVVLEKSEKLCDCDGHTLLHFGCRCGGI